MKKVSRRDFGKIAAAMAAVARAEDAKAADAAQAPALESTDWYAQSVADKRATAGTLSQFSIDVSTEPAFHFKA